MTGNQEPRTSRFVRLQRLGWKTWVLAPALAGALIGYVTAARTTPVYRSDTLILIVPQRVPENYVRSSVTTKIEDRLQAISQQILSRTRLERVIQEFKLYEPERHGGQYMENIVENMRRNIEVRIERGDAFRVGFLGTEPRTVQKVADRLSALFIEESLRDRSALADSAHMFLESQIEDVRRRLEDVNKQLRAAKQHDTPEAETLAIEYDALKITYKDLVTKKEDSRIAANLERRQIGEQFKLLDPARVAERPISPDYRQHVGVGALAGLGVGVLALLFGPSKPFKRKRNAPLESAAAPV